MSKMNMAIHMVEKLLSEKRLCFKLSQVNVDFEMMEKYYYAIHACCLNKDSGKLFFKLIYLII